MVSRYTATLFARLILSFCILQATHEIHKKLPNGQTLEFGEIEFLSYKTSSKVSLVLV